MADAKYYPDDWQKYCRYCKTTGGNPNPQWAIFAARFRVSGNYSGVFWFGSIGPVGKGYEAAIGFLLSYSAFEAACRAEGVNVWEVRLDDGGYLDECRAKIRFHFSRLSNQDFPLLNALTSKNLRRKLADFFSKKSDDLMPFAMALRNLFAHGFWTPTGSRALTKGACFEIDLLSQAVRLAGQGLFRQFLIKSQFV